MKAAINVRICIFSVFQRGMNLDNLSTKVALNPLIIGQF